MALNELGRFQVKAVGKIFMREPRGDVGHEFVGMPIAAAANVLFLRADHLIKSMLVRCAAMPGVIAIQMPLADEA